METNPTSDKNNDFNLALKLFDRVKSWDKAAYHYNDVSISYREIKDKSESLAASLRLNTIKNRDRVLLFMNDTPSFFIAFLGVLQVGAIPIALNPKSKLPSILHYLNDSGAAAVIGEPKSLSLLSTAPATEFVDVMLVVEDVYSGISADNCDNRSIDNSDKRDQKDLMSLQQLVSVPASGEYTLMSDSDIAFMQYTSGTTGAPKAVMHHGKGMLTHAEIYGKKILNITEDDVVYSVAKVFFGYGLGNSFYLPFYYNITTVIDSRWPTVQLVYENLKKYQPSILFAVPKIYSELLGYSQDMDKVLVNNLRLISAGSPLPGSLHSAWKQGYGLTILDGVGTTEMGHIYLTTTNKHSRASAVPGYEVRLVEVKYKESDSSRRGVLLVRGPSQSLGYYNNTEKTSEGFDDEGWYRTGDIFSQDTEGCYKFETREDDLFKVKGRWVSPVDVENFVIDNFKSVVDVALVKPEADMAEPDLSLFIVTKENKEKDNVLFEEIKGLIKDCFESHHLPKHISVLNEMPRNENGKLLRAKLSELASV